ncbi:TetR/AcrR family transcriptional regulator [Actinacidiphila sp. ITFR-21]|uniref:TetR/AcrR family transcriptional regulator n=1 Tax=Actinacidiphila sp. ITFR-21 TaxID=3075199 RepID=UPI00288C4B3E|nr:helix-turn-helix domain-containing protein [Streptomyces sp. ITFR-21]WNI16969.1 helix-turn-helix domain-containing protein [Streptomyces sp. ITFR-21]
MHIQDSRRATATGTAVRGGAGGPAPLRVDAQRNLEHVLRAAREVFGELGYGAPMEDVARRARVGVGTVYRRFPSKDVLVRRIAEEETARLTEQARTALGQENEAWSALARFLRTSAASGAGRLLPPQVLRVQAPAGGGHTGPDAHREEIEDIRVPQQRAPLALPGAEHTGSGHAGSDDAGVEEVGAGQPGPEEVGPALVDPARFSAEHTRAGDLAADPAGRAQDRLGTASEGLLEDEPDQGGIGTLLDVVGQLVERARAAGELRGDVSVADVLLVIATAAPALPDPDQHAAASARLLDILLEGLRSRPGERTATAAAGPR